MSEQGRLKRAQARPTAQSPRAAPTLAQALGARVVRAFDGWDELWSEALHGETAFAGGTLTIERAAAMTVIDIDGDLPPRALALAAVPALADAIRRFDLAGSIAIDFPTLPDKPDRRAVDDALAEALDGWPHERTAMNGFGLVQLIARLERPSLLDRVARWPEAAARMLLRRAERVTEPGTLVLTAPSRVCTAVRSEWEPELARRTGRRIAWRIDDSLAPDGVFAQAVAP